ncbi:hypothetical protein C7974DRAFT_375289 [Boeremia exigua]|uniref:uncharacterized protein n=1 Tax=Boeremia exigua TaxID=749465 RepID=UPI001E8E5FF5|nr:uncharacterized protein C7974DRAFT_375289 [Boeremia exigua]KAH6633168.1 hypothetical protein C7974DRAFT_375289 [Boeremia exigua]
MTSSGAVKLRYPRTSPPHGIFLPYKEGRIIIFSSLPVTPENYDVSEWLYQRLHSYNVLSRSPLLDGNNERGKCFVIACEFETREVAQEVVRLFNNSIALGSKIHVHQARPPMRVLGVSWSSGRNRAHYQPRDEGTADGTNFESMQDDVYRRWLLNKKDRGLWVPGHKY